jgi:hypothetical protein
VVLSSIGKELVPVRRCPAVVLSVLSVLAGVALAPAAASAAPGFDVQITELPGEFTAGRGPGTVTVVASTDRGRACQKVRWSMVMKVSGVRLDQVRVDRVEDGGTIPLAVQADGDTARLTDTEFDPGELCRGRTVTARYRVTFTEAAPDGRVTLQAEAYDRDEQLLELASATREVVGDTATPSAAPSPTAAEPSRTPAPEPSASGAGATASVPTAGRGGDTSLLGVGLIVGAVLIFFGVGLLLRVRLHGRAGRGPAPSAGYGAGS